ncbi:hypothetical protein D3C80_1727340 [compost metagenome]
MIPGQGPQGAGARGQHIGITVAPQLGHYAAILPLERGNLRRPHGAVPQIAVTKQQDRALTLVQVGQLTTRYLHHFLHVCSCCRQRGRQCSTSTPPLTPRRHPATPYALRVYPDPASAPRMPGNKKPVFRPAKRH